MKVPSAGRVLRKRCECAALLPQGLEIVAEHRRLCDLNDFMLIRERQRPKDDVIDEAEYRRRGAGRKREAQRGDDGEAGISKKRAEPKSCVLPQLIEPAGAKAVSISLFRLRHTAERDTGLTLSFIGRHSGSNVVGRMHIEMAPEFGIELVLVVSTEGHLYSFFVIRFSLRGISLIWPWSFATRAPLFQFVCVPRASACRTSPSGCCRRRPILTRCSPPVRA